MNRWGIDVSCPRCAGPLRLVNGTSNGLLSVTVVECGGCVKQFEITARLVPMAYTQAEINERHRGAA